MEDKKNKFRMVFKFQSKLTYEELQTDELKDFLKNNGIWMSKHEFDKTETIDLGWVAMVTNAANTKKLEKNMNKVVETKTGRKMKIGLKWRSISFNKDDGTGVTTKGYVITCEKEEKEAVQEALNEINFGREYPMATYVPFEKQHS